MKGKKGFQKGHPFYGDISHPHFFKKGQHPSPKTEFKKEIQNNKKNPFKKGHTPFNKGKEFKHDKSFKSGKEHWNWKHGTTLLQRQEISAGRKKPDKCELCGKKGKICYDHNHKTGKFRGWICRECNLVLGFIKDDPQTLKLMIDYIQKK